MTIETSDDGGMFTLSYCTVCDAATSGGDNAFLKSLGELQRQHKVDLELQTCKCEDALPNMLWRIKFVVE
jgi:hypothetical protein